MAYEKPKKRADRKTRLKKQADRVLRRQKKAEKEAKRAGASVPTPATSQEDPDVKRAEAAGLSLKKYKKKFAKGQIKVNPDGTPIVYSKKDAKREAKLSNLSLEETPSKKRKLEDEGEKSEKKKKKKSKD